MARKKINISQVLSIISSLLTIMACILTIWVTFRGNPSPVKEKEPVTNTTDQIKKKPEAQITEPRLIENQVILKYEGQPISNSYFVVDKYKSSVSEKSGIVTYQLPEELVKTNREHDFSVFRSDTLLYQKSMRFRNLDFNLFKQ